MVKTNLATSPVRQYAEGKNRYLYLQKVADTSSVDTFPSYEQWSFLPCIILGEEITV